MDENVFNNNVYCDEPRNINRIRLPNMRKIETQNIPITLRKQKYI